MDLDVSIDYAALRQLFNQAGADLQDAANAAVVRQTEETRDQMRLQIAQRLGNRTANTLTSRTYINTADGPKGPAGSVGGFIFSRWWRRPVRGGDQIDLLAAFERGDAITPRGGGLAIPTPQAYLVVGASRGGGVKRRPPTPAAVEAALGIKLFVLKRSGGQLALLCAKGVSTVNRGARGKIRAATYTNRKGLSARRRQSEAVIPMFVLLKNSRLPRRLNFSSIETVAETALAEKLLIELAKRGMLD
ncbi:MAG: DUF6441 family protein [Geminicoccaceae bacterium]